MTRGVRPARPFVPIGSAVLIIGGWFLVAHNSGDGWVQAIGDAVFAILAVGILGPAVILARTRVVITDGQFDGTPGLPVQVEVRASSRVRLRPVSPSGPQCLAGPVGPRVGSGPDSPSTLTLVPTRRGLFDALTVDVATASPFGLQWWTRRVELPLPAVLHISPRRAKPLSMERRQNQLEGLSTQSRPSHVGDPAGVRPYTAGDPRSHVHWPATAHNRALMVREMEVSAFQSKKVTVRLPIDPDEAERVAESAMGTLAGLIERGGAVLLSTVETSGEVLSPVVSQLVAGRRLARAVSAAGSAEVPEGFGVEVESWDS